MAYALGTLSQGLDFSGSSVGTLATTSITVEEGDTIAAWVYYFGGATTVTVTANDGGSDFELTAPSGNAANNGSSRIQCFYRANMPAGTYTVRVDLGDAQPYVGIVAIPISGLLPIASVAASANAQAAPGLAADAVTTTNATPPGQPALQIAIAINDSAGATPAAGTGFTSVGTFWSNPPDVARMEHRRLEATDATASTFTAGVNDSHLAAQMIFVESAEGVSGDGALAASASTVAGTGERVVTGSGAAQAQAATAVATGYRDVTGTGTLLVQSSAVSGSGGLQLKLVLTQATSRNLVDESGAPVANLAGIAYEWYDALDDTDGNPTQQGTFSTDENGEATIQLPNSALTSGQSGTLILYHPTDSAIRGVYRIPVT